MESRSNDCSKNGEANVDNGFTEGTDLLSEKEKVAVDDVADEKKHLPIDRGWAWVIVSGMYNLLCI